MLKNEGDFGVTKLWWTKIAVFGPMSVQIFRGQWREFLDDVEAFFPASSDTNIHEDFNACADWGPQFF